MIINVNARYIKEHITCSDKLLEQLLCYADCERCLLGASRNKVCVGSGCLPCDVAILMEAPGKTEDMLGYPACGVSGGVMRKALSDLGVFKKHSVFITNTVLCRPPGNRNPEPVEQSMCHLYVSKLLDLAAFEFLILVGAVALRYGDDILNIIRDDNSLACGRYGKARVYSISHPARILYDPTLQESWFYRMKKIMEDIDERKYRSPG